MLKYQLNIKNKNFKNIEVIYDSLFLDKDGSMITGVTDPSYGLSERNRINVVSNNRKSCYLEARDVMRCGYIIHNKKYQVNEFDTVIGILYSDGQYYCVEKDYEKIDKKLDEYNEALLKIVNINLANGKKMIMMKILLNGKMKS